MKIETRRMIVGDIPSALRLCRTAAWNQMHIDWLRLIQREPDGCFVAEADGHFAGTVTTIRYQNELAWIGMMLVDEAFRRQGIATALMEASLRFLHRQNVQCIKLDATPAGQPLYQRLGFQPEWSFHRWKRQGDESVEFQPWSNGHGLMKSHFQMDRDAFGADRSDWLQTLELTSNVVVHDGGFGMLRQGHVADYVGPVVAESSEIAVSVLRELLSRPSGNTLFWDLPRSDRDSFQLPSSLGFQPIRDLSRMWMGGKLIPGNVRHQFAIAEPATG